MWVLPVSQFFNDPAATEIYTRPGCGYCSAAKSLLNRK
ncbi:MAG: hypothetical protein G4V63_00155, partial [Candidatus Afipia apatlaquensis]|nr:hypothetical protein [Candidatus Afipia apatlaquensis]